MLGHPLYNKGDIVSFLHNGQEKTGKVSGVDSYGTFGQQEEPSYDIYIVEENCVYKHIRESWVLTGQI
ncbi:MAG: hypothetical protein IJ335_09365 [Lachnospiraceae bacterium]|nr:hypothetical protein [Lachnospiraceae bacterium]